MNIDKAFGVHALALQLRSRRAQILAANLANADTPRYQARDLDFKATLEAAVGKENTTLRTTHPRHLGSGGTSPAQAQIRVRTAVQASADGNTVDTQREQAAFAENAVQYQASLTFLNGKIKSLLTAIKGE